MIRLIAAVDRKLGIAKHGHQPWYIPADEQYFKDQTSQFGAVVLMGSKTFEVIGHPLKNRKNYILSREPRTIEGAEVVLDLQDFLQNFKGDIWVIGGTSVFEQTLAVADEVYLTLIEADFGCDQFFPSLNGDFNLASVSELQEQNGFIFKYCVYSRK